MRSTHTRTAAVTLGLALTVPAFAGSASATVGEAPQGKAVVSSTGAVEKVSPPQDARQDAFEKDGAIRAWDEQRLRLSSDLAVDITQPGTYGPTSDQTIPAGTCVGSQFLHLDLVGSGENGGLLTGSATTNNDVIGIVVTGSKLNASDYLGRPFTTYGKQAGRATETASSASRDQVRLSQDRRTVSVDMGSRALSQDQVRIITQASGCEGDEPEPVVPEAPLAVALPLVALAGGGALVLARRRRTA